MIHNPLMYANGIDGLHENMITIAHAAVYAGAEYADYINGMLIIESSREWTPPIEFRLNGVDLIPLRDIKA